MKKHSILFFLSVIIFCAQANFITTLNKCRKGFLNLSSLATIGSAIFETGESYYQLKQSMPISSDKKIKRVNLMDGEIYLAQLENNKYHSDRHQILRNYYSTHYKYQQNFEKYGTCISLLTPLILSSVFFCTHFLKEKGLQKVSISNSYMQRLFVTSSLLSIPFTFCGKIWAIQHGKDYSRYPLMYYQAHCADSEIIKRIRDSQILKECADFHKKKYENDQKKIDTFFKELRDLESDQEKIIIFLDTFISRKIMMLYLNKAQPMPLSRVRRFERAVQAVHADEKKN